MAVEELPEELPEEVDTTDEEDTETDEDDDCGSTQYPPEESSIVVDSPRKDRSSIDFEEISLPRVRRQSRKAAENEEVFSQRTSKRARKKNIKKPKPLKKPNARASLRYKSRRTASTGRQNQEVVDLVDSSPPELPGPASELDTTQWQESESEPITYTLVWRVVVGNTPIANTAKRMYVYCFRYHNLIN